MNILLIRSDTGLAGPAKLMHAYAKALRNAGHRVCIASGGGEYATELEKDGFPHITIDGLRIGARNPLLMPIHIMKIAALMKRERIDVVNSFNAHAGLMAYFADPLQRARHFNTVLGTGHEWTNKILSGHIFRGRIIAVSNDVRNRLIEVGVSPDKISVVYNSTLDGRFFAPLPDRSSRNEPIRLCGIAMFTGNKGQEYIIPLMAQLVHDYYLDLQLTLVGDGPSRKTCEQMAANLGISDRVRFTGALIEVVPELDLADIFIHLPKTETFGIVLAEAMARALPIVTVRVGGVPEVVEDGETGIILASREDTSGLLTAIEQLVSHPARREQMGQRGQKAAFDRFSLQALERDLNDLYQSRQ